MVEYLYDLLTRNRLFDVAVYGTECALLCGIVFSAELSDGNAAEQEQRDKYDRDQRQDPACRYHENKGSDQSHTAADQLRQRVVDHDVDVVDIVGEPGHDLAGLPGIEKSYGQSL